MSFDTNLADRVEGAVLVVSNLAKIAIGNEGFRGSDVEPQLDAVAVDALLRAVVLISDQIHTDFCELLNTLEAPR